MVGAALLLVGCGGKKRVAETFDADVVQIVVPPGEKPCVDRLLARSRVTGYIEQTVDKDAGFFRVLARNKRFRPTVDAKGRPDRMPKGQEGAVVEFYNVQCTSETAAVITPMNGLGPVARPFVLDGWQNQELADYAQQLGLPSGP